MRSCILLTLFCVVIAPAFAQYHTHTMRNYKAVDGLPQSQVNIMLEDKNGYLWIGTEGGGLARFDGREFKVYTTLDGLHSNIVSYLKLDTHENLWIVHPRGLTKFDGISFVKFPQPEASSSMRRVRRAFEIQDTLFFLTAPGYLGKIHNDSLYYWARPLKENVLIHYVHLTSDKDVLMYLSDSSFYVHDGKTARTFKHAEYFNRVYGLMFNYNSEVWARTDSGYVTVDAKNQTFRKASLPFDDPIVFYDSLNNQFWARNNNHLLRVRFDDKHTLQTDTVLRDVNVRQILVDSEGNTWFATMGNGLYKYFIQDFDRCSSEKMKGVTAIHRDQSGATWIGSMTKGLWRVAKGKISSYDNAENSYRNNITAIAESKEGVIWIGTSNGLANYDADSDDFNWFSRDEGLSNTSITAGLQFDNEGGLWIGTQSGGLNYYDGKTFKAFTTRQGLTSNNISALHYSNRYNSLFIGNEFGLTSLKGNRFSQIAMTGFENTTVFSINAYRDSLLLIGSGGAGFAVYSPLTGFRKQFTTHHGLASDFIYFVTSDEDDYIWIGSEKGITRIKLNNSYEIVENLHFDQENGLTGVETNQNAYYLSGNTKFFGLIDGLYQFNDENKPHQAPFNLHLTDVQILYGDFAAREFSNEHVGFFKVPNNPAFPPDKNHISFYFNRVNKRYPKSVKFRYYLENFDKTWSRASSVNHVTYSNIPPGEYTFHVISTNGDGSWNQNEVTYKFKVMAPFYQMPSFIIGVVIVAVGLVMLALYWRVKHRVNAVMERESIRAKEQENLRKEIARDFHDEMGNQLTRIINYVSLLKLNGNGASNGTTNGNKSHSDLYAKVENSAKYLYSGTRDFIWSIDPVNDELNKLFIHIRDFGEKLFEEKNISFRAFNEVKDPIKLPYGFSREANLIFKEAMTNAFKYSNAENVNLTLSRTRTGFQLRLEDDGIGFSTDGVQKSNGLKNISERAQRLNADLRINSNHTSGTSITLQFTLNKSLKYGITI